NRSYRRRRRRTRGLPGGAGEDLRTICPGSRLTSECGREWPRAGPRRPECPVAGRTGLGRARAGRWRQVRRRVAGGTIVSRWIGGLMVALLATACGVPLDSAPETIAVDLGDASELDLPVGDDLAPVTFF